MTAQAIFFVILIILIADFTLERILSAFNVKSSRQPIPALLTGIYDEEKYQKQQSYFRVNTKFGLLTSSVRFFILILMVFFGGFGWLDGVVRAWSGSPVIISLVFFGILFLANDIISTPFEVYETFVIEERFGFNKTTHKTFILDKLKGYALTSVLGGGIIALIMWFYELNPEYFWLIAWASVTAFSLIMNLLYSEIIVPLFNKQTPLEPGELRDGIEKFAQKVDFQLKNIYVIDGSRRSTKANAYFTGFGKKKRIVLYDTLINDLTIDEITSVLAHEAGHNKHKHTVKNMLIHLNTEGFFIYVIDEGTGIDESKDLFAPFKRYGNQTGAGLGLFLAKNAADALGAKITLKNREDAQGTIATLFLPSRKHAL